MGDLGTFLPFHLSLFLIAMASNPVAMASNLLAMASNLGKLMVHGPTCSLLNSERSESLMVPAWSILNEHKRVILFFNRCALLKPGMWIGS